jgi:chitinase
MALLARGVNNAKGTWFGLGMPSAYPERAKLRKTKIHNRDVAGVFQYMKDDTIFNKWQATAHDIETALQDFDNAYGWNGAEPGELGRPNRPNAGLRDLWCYFIDRYMATIEANIPAWTSSVQNTLQNDRDFQGTEGKNFVTNFFTHQIVTSMSFRHPGTRTPGPGTVVRNSYYGAWDDSNGPAGPF